MKGHGLDTLATRASQGALWSTLGFVASQMLRLASNVFLTRLLFAEAFGLMVLVQTLLIGLQLFSDIGIGTSIIQSKHGDEPSFLHTAFSIQAIRGGVLWFLACLAAIPFARFYGQPELAWLIPFAGLTAVIQGLQSTKLYTANRHLRMGRLTLIDLISQVLGIGTMLIWAFAHRSVWALVGGSIVSSVSTLVMSHLALPGIGSRFGWDKESARKLMALGRWIFVSTALMFLAGQSDRLIFGKMIPLNMLGVYAIAFTLASVLTSALANLTGKIVLPVFSRIHTSGGDLRIAYRQVRLPLLTVGGWASAGLLAGGPTAVRLIYDQRYLQAGWMLQVIAAGAWFGVLLEGTNGAALLAKGLARWTAAGSAGKLLGMLTLIPVGYLIYGFPGALFGLAGAEMVRYIVSVYATTRQGLRGLAQDLSITSVVAVSATAGWLASTAAKTAHLPIVLEALVVFVIVTLFWIPLGIRVVRQRANWLPVNLGESK